MDTKSRRYQLEFRYLKQLDWLAGSAFPNLKHAKQCMDDTLSNNHEIGEGRIFDLKLMAYRYYRTAYPFKP